jgi:SRSO17 transposase
VASKDNCQVAVSLHLATDTLSACIGMRLFPSESWDQDQVRRTKAKIPSNVQHREKWKLALDMLDDRKEWGLGDKVRWDQVVLERRTVRFYGSDHPALARARGAWASHGR